MPHNTKLSDSLLKKILKPDEILFSVGFVDEDSNGTIFMQIIDVLWAGEICTPRRYINLF